LIKCLGWCNKERQDHRKQSDADLVHHVAEDAGSPNASAVRMEEGGLNQTPMAPEPLQASRLSGPDVDLPVRAVPNEVMDPQQEQWLDRLDRGDVGQLNRKVGAQENEGHVEEDVEKDSALWRARVAALEETVAALEKTVAALMMNQAEQVPQPQEQSPVYDHDNAMVKNVFSAALKELPMMEEGISDSSNGGTSFDHRQQQQQQQQQHAAAAACSSSSSSTAVAARCLLPIPSMRQKRRLFSI
jgi:hypothetical protein